MNSPSSSAWKKGIILCMTWANPASKHIFNTYRQSSLSRISRVSPIKFLKLSSPSLPTVSHKLSTSVGSMNFVSGLMWWPFLVGWFEASFNLPLIGTLWFGNSIDCRMCLMSRVSSSRLNFSFKDISPKMSERQGENEIMKNKKLSFKTLSTWWSFFHVLASHWYFP